MFLVLDKLGIPEKRLRLIKGFYQEVNNCFMINGHVSRAVAIKSGVRQGCPLSPIIFIGVIEALLKSVERDKVVCGGFIPGKRKTDKSPKLYG